MKTADRVALYGLVFAVLLQAFTAVRWAARIDTVQTYHSQEIQIIRTIHEEIPVIKSQVSDNKNDVDKLVMKMDDLIGIIMTQKRGS